jgi:hypothetical protein
VGSTGASGDERDHAVATGHGPRSAAAPVVARLDARGQDQSRRWWAAFASVMVLGGLWLVATPLYGAPDEPNHAMRAVSVAQGQLLGETPPQLDGTGRTVVHVPGWYARTRASCFTFKPEVPAACLEADQTPDLEGSVIQIGRYPPLYYLVTGLAGVPLGTVWAVLAMRFVSLVVCAVLLASALVSVSELPGARVAGLGVAVAVTPMAAFLFGVLNPNGPEIAAAIGVWASGYVLATDPSRADDRALVLRLTIASVVLVAVRPTGPLWLALIGLSLLALSTRPHLGALVRARAVRLAGMVIAGCAVASGVWLLAARSFEYDMPEHHRAGGLVELAGESLRSSWDRGVVQMVGNVGWLDTPAPPAVVVAWVALVGLVVVVGLARARSRAVLVVAAVTVLTVLIPAVADAVGAAKGFEWQGRYTLPLAVGIPLVAAFEAGRPRRRPRPVGRGIVAVAVAVITVAQVVTFGLALRRYAVGADSPVSALWQSPAWAPHHIHPLVLVAGYAAAVLAFCAVAVAAGGSVPAPGGAAAGAADEPEPGRERAGLAP